MGIRFKKHIEQLKRRQTSLGRDIARGIRLDRNERVAPFDAETAQHLWQTFTSEDLSVSPETGFLYERIAKTAGVARESLYIVPGITEGIRILYEIFTDPGDNVIVLDPTYPMYRVYADMYRLDYRKFDFAPDLTPDRTRFYGQLDARSALVLLPNPNLPVENVFTKDEISTFAGACRDNGTILVIDEAYYHFGAPTVIDLIKEFPNLIVMRSFSKAYGLAGIRLGFIASAPENIAYIANTRSLVEANTFSMKIADFMLAHPAYRDEHIRQVAEGSAFLKKALDRLCVRYHGGTVTNGILIFLASPEAAEQAVRCMREQKIYIRGNFEPPYTSCIRVSIGPASYMKTFVDAFTRWYTTQR